MIWVGGPAIGVGPRIQTRILLLLSRFRRPNPLNRPHHRAQRLIPGVRVTTTDPIRPEHAGFGSVRRMHLVAALFVENFEIRQAPGPSTRLDLTGAMFSMAAPEPAPVTVSPHLVALIYCPSNEAGSGVFEVVFTWDPILDESAEPVARNVNPFTVEPGKFTYRLVRGELDFPDYRQIFAHCRIDRGPWLQVPFTLLAPVD